jgi:hypothetical protein
MFDELYVDCAEHHDGIDRGVGSSTARKRGSPDRENRR